MRDNGARIVHGCGFDSIPADLGVHFTVGQLPEGVPLTVDGHLRARGVASAGTYRTVSLVLARRRPAAGRAGDPGGGDGCGADRASGPRRDHLPGADLTTPAFTSAPYAAISLM
ncbi:hypothetical protein ACIBF5_25695 [Micromonospora sp. NPDC050417]|uniref:hypothetical protein n=1 Tax=Micromonospora sp. NPDC050417 TaxID=3364280 RepID=UPI003795599F